MSEVLRLLDAYVAVAGGSVERPEGGLRVFRPAPSEAAWFGGEARVLALDIESMDLHPDAEVAVAGSRFAHDLLAAVRSRGARLHRGFVAPSDAPGSVQPTASLVLRRGRVREVRVEAGWLPVGRLHLAASVRTGSQVEDRLVQTGWFDLTAGQPLGEAPEGIGGGEAMVWDSGSHPVLEPRPLETLLPGFLDDIEDRLAQWLAGAGAEAERTLQRELARLDAYYGRLVEEAGDGEGAEDAVRAYRQEHERRTAEQIARNQASAELRPVQLELGYVLTERALMVLDDGAAEATLTGRRLLVGEAGWALPCPTCHTPAPEAWAVCTGGHMVCSACTESCSLCGATSCGDHGGGACPGGEGVPAHTVCDAHGQRCPSCAGTTCAHHAGLCLSCDQPVCSTCLGACASCGQAVCRACTTPTATEPRPLCPACVRYCRGRDDEVRGVDEVAPCGTCGADVCPRHREVCAVCGEPHCREHVVELEAGEFACPPHQGVCVVDGRRRKITELDPCPVCGEWVSAGHRAACASCGGWACTRDVDPSSQECRTCGRLEPTADPDEALIEAFSALVDPGLGRPAEWSVARDATRRVARVKLSSWGRSVIFALDHRSEVVTSGVFHGRIFTRRLTSLSRMDEPP